MNARKIARIVLIVVLIIIAVVVIGFFIWTGSPYPPMPEALVALEDSDTVDVEQVDNLWTFTPLDGEADTGFIFYPGALVDPRAYAPMVRNLAEDGYFGVIVSMPRNLAVLDMNAAAGVTERYPDIQDWVISGHSLGGVMAAQFAAANTGLIDGLGLLAAYPSGDMSDADVEVTSIYASNDGLADVETVEASAEKLPADTEFVLIEGGNHAQFGYYGDQSGDNLATISREEQQAQTVEALLALLERSSGG